MVVICSVAIEPQADSRGSSKYLRDKIIMINSHKYIAFNQAKCTVKVATEKSLVYCDQMLK